MQDLVAGLVGSRCSQELGQLEARRWALQQEISRRMGRPESEVSLQDLAEQRAPGAWNWSRW